MSTDPGSILFGRTRGRLLAWLFGHPGERFPLRLLARHAQVAVGAAQRELKLLASGGLVTRTPEGNQVYFQADQASPLFEDLQRVVLRSTGAVAVLRAALAPFGKKISVAWIFGSVARGSDLRSSSDVDLLVIGTVPFEEVVGALSPAAETLGREVNPTVYSPREFLRKLAERHHFVSSVLQQSREYVIGGSVELERLGAEQLASEARDQRGGDHRTPRHRRARPRGQRRGQARR